MKPGRERQSAGLCAVSVGGRGGVQEVTLEPGCAGGSRAPVALWNCVSGEGTAEALGKGSP